MPTFKSARERMRQAVADAIADGNSALANEITANVMVGTTMLIVFVLLLICFGLNEIGVFTVDKTVMRWSVLAASIVELPITIVNFFFVGTKPWLRRALVGDLVVVCAILACALGHNVTMVMILPTMISTRYFDQKYTAKVAVFTAVIFLAAAVLNGFFGVINLNVYLFSEAVSLHADAGQTLREALSLAGFERSAYIKNLLLNEFIPRCMAFLAMSVTCRFIAQRGKDMIDMESEKTRKTARIETELDLATRIQTSMLPCYTPAFPGHEDIDLQAVYYPAKEVGGDFYDYFIIDKTHVGVVIADVSGKGVGAALFMTISKMVIKNQMQLGISPAEAMTNANRQLCENNDAGLFVTCWVGVYDTESHMMTFVNAGHNPPVLLRKGQAPCFIPQRSGLVLAGMEDTLYTQEQLELSRDDEIFFYTDGVSEAMDRSEQLFGNARLLECLDKSRSLSNAEQISGLKQDIDRFADGQEQFDDITIMCMKINE
ncbi:MAG: PP2C family protein-serine/threonine phosphatase [Clostridia bacterium]|nr:PP2C family protein-serine/threonine phosphatase [Clostridia bacterium]